MSKNTTPIQVTGKHVFTQEERDSKLSELLAAIQRKEELDAEKKQVMSGYKNKLDEQESNIKVISNLLNMGFEHRPFSCYLTKDFDAGKRFYNEVGTGTLISTEPLTAADYQTAMDMQEAEIKSNNDRIAHDAEAPTDEEKEVWKSAVTELLDKSTDEAPAFQELMDQEDARSEANQPLDMPIEAEISPAEEFKVKKEDKTSKDKKAPVIASEVEQKEDEKDPFDFGDDDEIPNDNDNDDFSFSI